MRAPGSLEYLEEGSDLSPGPTFRQAQGSRGQQGCGPHLASSSCFFFYIGDNNPTPSARMLGGKGVGVPRSPVRHGAYT